MEKKIFNCSDSLTKVLFDCLERINRCCLLFRYFELYHSSGTGKEICDFGSSLAGLYYAELLRFLCRPCRIRIKIYVICNTLNISNVKKLLCAI